jgi:1-acyl-sn-glycerol-3-phosphate acyltransferase
MGERIRVPWFHPVANAILRFLIPCFLRVDVRGIENTPRTGRLIAATNHTSFIDPILSSALLREDVLPIAKVELFGFPFGFVFYWYGAFPIRRGEGDLAAMKRALSVLRDEHVMLISPEGTRTKSGTLESAREGTALLAIKSGAPVLPVAIWGGKLFWRNLSRLRRTYIGMRIGEPLVVVGPKGKPTRDDLRAITDEIMLYIAQMLPAEYRGVYANSDSWVPRYVFPMSEAHAASRYKVEKEVVPLRA